MCIRDRNNLRDNIYGIEIQLVLDREKAKVIDVDLSEAAEAAVADGDYLLFLDGGATGTAAKEAVHDLATLFAGTGLTASSSVIGVDTSQAITALTGGDLTIYDDANNADVSLWEACNTLAAKLPSKAQGGMLKLINNIKNSSIS